MPPGYRVELVASEPLIQEPVALDWDVAGRLWAVEMPGFMADLTGSNEHEPIGRVVVLEDTNGDGRMDKRTVFADRLVLARSIKVLDRGVLVAEPPNLWLMKDTTGDLKMDSKELVTGSVRPVRRRSPEQRQRLRLGARQPDVHGRPGRHAAPPEERRVRGHPHAAARRMGRHSGRRRTNLPQHQRVGRARRPGPDGLLRAQSKPGAHPRQLRSAGHRQRGPEHRLAGAAESRAPTAPIRRASTVPDGTLVKFTSVCAPLVYRGDRLPAEVYGNVFVAEPAANLVARLVLEDDGRRAWPRARPIPAASSSPRPTSASGPVFITNAPDGTMYIADLYRGIIEHRISITEYLRDQILERRLDRATGFGRIYRVVHETTRAICGRR